MSHFEIAHKFTAKWEGGLSDHSSDPGGITNYGVSLRWLCSLGHQLGDIDLDGDIDAADVRKLTPATAASLFQERFWKPYKLSLLPQSSATLHYDCMVNTGPRQAALITQRACNKLIGVYGVPLEIDGILGHKTREFLIKNTNELLVKNMLEGRKAFYISLTEQKASLQVFLKGWLNRCTDLEKYLSICKEA